MDRHSRRSSGRNVTALLALVAASPALARTHLLVLSRHSGEVLAGTEFILPGSLEVQALATDLGGLSLSAREVAEAARRLAEAGRPQRRASGDPLVEVDADRVVVRDPGVAAPAPSRGDGPVEVQVFGLVGPERVHVLCRGRAVRVRSSEVEELAAGWQTLAEALGTGSLLCSGGPWQVRIAGSEPRPYAGVLSFRPLSPRQPEAGSTRREARARRGSEVIFRTTLSAYVSGVLAAEHAGLGGEAGRALAQVIAHDAHVERHPGRPLCDTTHCQVFLGTAAPTPEVTEALTLPELPTARWLPYSRGGGEPWELRRSVAEVRTSLGDVQRFGGSGRILEVVRSSGVERIPCEPVRAALRLPSCPTEGVVEGETVRIRGHGRGHGLGLDVEAARTSGLTAAALLQRAYGLR